MAKSKTIAAHVPIYLWYCETILRRPPSFANDGNLLTWATKATKAAKELGGDGSDVMLCMMALHKGGSEITGFVPWDKWAQQRRLPVPITFWELLNVRPDPGRAGDNLLQLWLAIPDPPSVGSFPEYAEWLREFGQRARARGIWNGIVPWTPNQDPHLSTLPPAQVAALFGKEVSERSLIVLRHVEELLHANQRPLFGTSVLCPHDQVPIGSGGRPDVSPG